MISPLAVFIQHTCTHTHYTQDSCDVIRDTKSFCRRVSQKEYECQMKMTSQQSISSLLDKIASDENMTDREKKQRLKLVTILL